ncbi:MAG: hypothetical protein AB1489_09330 [Acidobacteriota bacterium]
MRLLRYYLGNISLYKPKIVVSLCILVLLSALLIIWKISNQAHQQLARAHTQVATQDRLSFKKDILSTITSNEIKILQSTQNVRAIVQFKDSYFIATDGGLVELSLSGQQLHRYNVLNGLPESDLVSLAVLHSRLYIGTRSQGLVVFDGEHFERYYWPNHHQQAISVLLTDNGRLLIGTFAGGLIEFDGKQFKEIKAGADQQRLVGINYLAKIGTRLYVGSYADGLWVQEAGRWRHITTADGLLSNRIVAVAANDQHLWVASDFGLVVSGINLPLEAGSRTTKDFQTLAILPSLAGLMRYGKDILLCKDNGEIFVLAEKSGFAKQATVKEVLWERPHGLTNCRFIIDDNQFWLLSSLGIWQVNDKKLPAVKNSMPQLSLVAFSQLDDSNMPASNLISALAFDATGRLWSGSFRNGLDIFNLAGKRTLHLESDTIREINFLLYDKQTKHMLVATSQGVISFDDTLNTEWITTSQGLLSNAVSHIALMPTQTANKTLSTHSTNSAMLLATSRGLAIGTPDRLHALTSLHGLPSNNLYTALPYGKAIYVGTLGGLAEIESNRVVRIFKDSNSKLTHNWITAVCNVGPHLFIGSYGGGVFELMPTGELRSFAVEIGKCSVNPNAMFSDDERLYVGTLDGAWVLELDSQKWVRLKAELPAPVVLSINGNGKSIYFGTTAGIAQVAPGYWEKLFNRAISAE